MVRARVLSWKRERPSESHRREDDVDDSMPTGRFEFVFNIGIIVYVEMAIKWNHISGVNSLSSPGQFMPFFIALAQLFATLYRLVKHAAIMVTTEDDGEEDGKFL